MESRDLVLVSVSRRVSRPIFRSHGLGLECFRSRLGLEGFRSRSRALHLETLHSLFLMKVLQGVPLTTAQANILARPFLAINRQPLELESCSKPPRMRESLGVKIEKTIFRLGFELFCMERHK